MGEAAGGDKGEGIRVLGFGGTKRAKDVALVDTFDTD